MAVLAALTLGACAPSVPLAGAQADAEGKQFQPPSAGSAAAYFYVSRAGDSFAVLSGKRHLGTIGSNAWIRADLPAGSHDLGCAIDGFAFMTSPAARNDPRGNWSGETHRTFDLASRQTYFFEIGVTAAPGSITCTIAEVAASHGRTKIMERSRAIEVR